MNDDAGGILLALFIVVIFFVSIIGFGAYSQNRERERWCRKTHTELTAFEQCMEKGANERENQPETKGVLE